MTEILLRSREQILGDLVRSILANSDFSDFAPGSTLATLLEAVASVCYQNFLMVLKLLESTDLESMTGVALDRKAASIGLPDGIGGVGRKPASPASGLIQITDPRTPKKSSKLYAGKPAPYSGGTVVYVEDASTWPDPATNPKIYIGRGTAGNLEGPIKYVTKTDNGVFWTLQLEGTLTKNHSISETVVLAQGGDRVIPAGTSCQTTPNASTPAINFTTDAETVILDGDDTTTTTVTCAVFGESGNALAGALNRFGTQPFPEAQVRNITSYANGKSTENDEELRQRIRDYPATLSRGTRAAITAALLGLRDPDTGKAIASVVVIEPTEPGEPSKIFINDGSLLEPTFSGQPYELFVKDASGQEVFFKTTYSPVTPCVALGANEGPYSLEDLMTLTVTIDGINETFTITGNDYLNLETATPLEIVRDFNSQANICSFRTIDGAKGVAVFDLSGKAETMTIQANDLQTILGLPTSEIKPVYLYKNGEALSFRGKTATLTTNQHPWSLTSSDLRSSVVRVDNSYQVVTINDADFAPYFSNITSATVDHWISVLKTKVNGVSFQKVGARIVWSTFQSYTPDSYLEILPKVARPGVYHFSAGEIVITTDSDYGINSLGLYNQLVTIFNASDVNLNGEYIAKIGTVGGVTEIRFVSPLSTTGTLSWFHSTNPDAGWIGSSKMWASADSSLGASKDFQFNRFTGEIRLTEKPETGSIIEVGSLSTRAKVRSKSTVGGLYSIPPNMFGSSKLILSFDDSAGEIKETTIGVSSKLTVGTPSSPDRIIRLEAFDGIISDSRIFINAVAGDWIYLVNYTGSGWDSSIGGLYLIKQISPTTEWIEIEVDAVQYPLFTGTHDLIGGSLFIFSSKVTPQVVDFGALSTVTVDQVVNTINAQIHSGRAEKISAEQFIIRTNSYEIGASVNLFGTIGNANTILTATTAISVQPHVAAIQTQQIDGGFAVINNFETRTIPSDGYGTRGYLAVKSDYADVIDTLANPTVEAASVVTDYPLGYQTAFQTGRLSNYTGRIYNTSNIAPFTGFIRGEDVIRPAYPFDTVVDAGVVKNYRNISLRMRDLPVTKDDKLVVEMDLNSVEKTVIIPMHKKAVIETCSDIVGGGNAYSMQFTLLDPDDANKPFFDVYSTYKDFNLNDFRLLTKSVGVYKYDTFATAVILRSLDVEAANRLKFFIRYPSAPDKADIVVSHRSSFVNLVPETTIMAELSSGPLVSGSLLTVGTMDLTVLPNGGSVDITFSGTSLDPTKYTTGDILKLSGNHPLSGSYLITGTTLSTVTCNAPGLMRYKTVTTTGCTAYTSSSSNVVVVNKTNHGLLSGDKVNITATSAIDGISALDLSVVNASVVMLSADSFSYTANATANTPPTGAAQVSFPYTTRTLTTTPGSSDILVTQVGHPFVGGEGIDVNFGGTTIGGLPAANINLTNAIVSYVNANQFKYTATALAPSNAGSIDFSRSHIALTFMTTQFSSTVTVTHVGHKYINGATLTFSMAVKPVGSSLNNSDFNGTYVITVSDPDTYTYTIPFAEANVPSANGTIDATYGPYTASALTGNNTATVAMTYSVHYLLNGATVNTSASADIGGIPLGNLSVSNAVITYTSASAFTFTASAVAPAWSASAPVRRTTRAVTLAVPQLPPPGSSSVNVSLTDHRIKTGEQFYIINAPVGGIGGMTQAELQNNSALLTATSILTNSFIYLSAGLGDSPSGAESFLRLLTLQASQYNLSSYPLNPAKNVLSNLVNKINSHGTATAEVSGNAAFTITQATYNSHPVAYDLLMENFLDMETAYDFHSFACKHSGSAAIYDYNPTGGYIAALISTVDAIFPTLAESTDGITQLYSPVGEEVYIVPSNGNTLSRWMGFSSISSLSAQSNVEETDSSQKVQISSLLVGFDGAVKIKGVTANRAEMYAIGNASAVYDPYQANTGLLGASKVAVDAASSSFIPCGSMVKISNTLPSTIFRPYRLQSPAANITSANTSDIVTYFRGQQFVQYSKQGAGIGRFAFYRNGMGLSQTEPMANTGAINVTFSSVSGDLVKVTINTSDLSARVGDMMMIFGDVKKSLSYAEQVGGSTVRYALGAGVKSDLWIGLNITVSGFGVAGFNGTFAVTDVGTYSGGTYDGRDYIDVSNATAGTSTASAMVTVALADLPFAGFPLITCKNTDLGYSNAQEYMGYPVVQVNNSREVIVIAPSIKQEITNNGGPVTITLNPHLYPLDRKLIVFLSSVYNEKNIRSNRYEGSMYESTYGTGNLKVLVRKLPGGFVSIWASNTTAENTDTLKLSEMQVNTDDWLTCNNEFALNNRGTFKIIAHNGRNQVIVYNPSGENEDISTANGGSTDWLVGPLSGDRPMRVLAAENIFTGDYIKITSPNSSVGTVSWVPISLIGSFKIYSTGYTSAADHDYPLTTFDTTLLCPAVDFILTSAPATSDVNGGLPFILGANASAITFQKAAGDYGYRYVAGRTIDPVDKTKGHLYLLPESNSLQITNTLGSKISCLFKLGASESVVRGIDSYMTFSGLLSESHKVIDGNPSNTSLYPGVRAAGTSIEILTPLVKSIVVRLQIKPKDGVDSSIIAETVRATVAGYINKLSVGKPVILSEIIRAVQSLPGVFSVTIIDTKPTSQGDRIVVGDVEKAIVFDAENDVIVS